MKRITILSEKNNSINISFRKNTAGLEINLVYDFIDYFINLFKKKYKKKDLAIFIEPKVGVCFPDIVCAIYSPSIKDYRNESRDLLDELDMKVLSQIIYSKACTKEHLIETLCFSEYQMLCSLEKLFNALLIDQKHGIWSTTKFERVYSIDKLLSFEAKIGNTNSLTNQTIQNTWFATESYAIIGNQKISDCTLDEYKKHGIGLYYKDNEFRKVLNASALKSPRSYQTLMFNEWIGKAVCKV